MSEDNNGGMSCNTKSWIIGALFGIAALLIATKRFDLGLIIALIIGLLVMVGVALLVRKMFCSEIAGASVGSTTVAAAVAGGAAASAAVASTASASASKATDAVAGAVPAVKAKATGSTKTAAKAVGTAATSAKKTAKKAAAKKPAAKKAAAKPAVKAAAKTAAKKATKPAAKAAKPAAKKPVAKKAAPKTATKPARKPVAADGKPEMLKKARAGGADDLKMIKGVGPKMETMLNGMGFYHFDQVSGWRAKEVKWVDDNLEGFKGRVSRDEWVKQAKILAKGGTTEFSNKVKKGGVYKN